MNNVIRSIGHTGAAAEAATPRRLQLLAAAFLAVLAMAVALVAPGNAGAAEGIKDFSMVPSETQAGGHPNVTLHVEMLQRINPPSKTPCFCDDVKTITFHLPTGFIGNPHSQAICTLTEFNLANCPITSQIGTIALTGFGSAIYTPLYNLETHPNQAGALGYVAPLLAFPNFIDLRSRTESDYGLDSASFPIPHLLVFGGVNVNLWGVPAAPTNNFYRFKTPLSGFGECGFLNICGDEVTTNFPSPAPETPFLQNPTTCGEELTGSVDLAYYDGNVYHQDTKWPAPTGCQVLSFNPSISVTPTTEQADAPSGVDIDLKVPQTQSPATPSPSEIRTTTVTLPEGFSINSGAADGKTLCKANETSIGTRAAAHCPEGAKVGTLALDNAALPGPIDGALYLGESLPGEKFRLILTADGFATHVKLPGTIRTDPSTGAVTVEFADLPQTPNQRFNMHIFGSERGMLATPTRCGKYPVQSTFVPWDNELPSQDVTSYFTVNSGPNGSACPGSNRPFGPSFEAGSVNPTGGMYTPFGLRVSRPDGDQLLSRLNFTAPEGLTARLKGVTQCPQSAIDGLAGLARTGLAELAASSCPASSEVGTAVSSAGAGSHPVFTRGKVYLAGPYKGAPLSLVTVIPAISGPYDLGNVAVRSALFIDPETAQVTAVSDQLPQLLEGIPLRIRSLQVSLDRPGFTLNPTNCTAKSIGATLFGSEGAVAGREDDFQAANCGELDFAPKLSLKLAGKTSRAAHPALKAVLTTGQDEANIARAVVTLPPSELLDQGHIATVCTRAQFAAGSCPADSVYGQATVTTPLLDQPLEGPVYLRSGKALPDMVADLKGEIDVVLVGHIDSKKGGLRATFGSVPDVPVSRFVLNMQGGKKGLIQNGPGVCARSSRASIVMVGQNAAKLSRHPRLQSACGSERKARARGRHR
jgi:hypothetical protein